MYAVRTVTALPQRMPDYIACPGCLKVGMVRAERVFRGDSVSVNYYCLACEHAWRLVLPDPRIANDANHKPKIDRRQTK